MKRKANLAALGLVGISAPLFSQQSMALDAAATGANGSDALETIIVTAEKRAEPLKDVPMSVTALSSTALENLQAKDFQDYAALVPGLSLQTTQPGFTRLTLRGQNSGGVGSTVAVYLDESPFGSSNALLNGGINTGDLDTWDLQRIEVLRGPQGTLYGANSEGGLLKFVANAPILGSFSGAAELSGESVAHGSNGGDIRAMVNLPMGDKFALRLSGYDDDVPGYIADPSLGVKDINEGHVYGGRASLLAALTDDLSIKLTATGQHAHYGSTNSVDTDPVTLQPLHGDLTQERLFAEPSTFKYENYNATIDWNAGPVHVLSTTSYGILQSDQVEDATPLYGGLAGALFAAPGAAIDANIETKKFTQEIRLSSNSKGPLDWLVGGYFTREIGALVQNLNGVTVPDAGFVGLIEKPTVDSVYKEMAGFVDLTYHFNSQWDLQGGLRYSHNDQTANQTTLYNPLFGILPNPTLVNGASSGNVTTYSLSPSWHFDANSLLYVRLATGYRPGGPNVIPPGAPANVETEYGADKTTNIELGVRSTQFDGRLSFDAALFHVDWKNIQLFEVVNGFGINSNGGTARSQGLEWTIGYVPVHGLTFQWVGAYTDAKLTSPAPTLNANSGDPLPYAPKWSTSLDGEYEWSAFADYRYFIGATWSYVGTRTSDFGLNIPPTPPTSPVELPSYNTIAVRVGLENERYRMMFFGKNLSDTRGITNYAGVGSPYPGINVIQPRTIGVTLSAKF